MTTTTLTNPGRTPMAQVDVYTVADLLNDLAANDRQGEVRVNGFELAPRRDPASGWGTGSLSVEVRSLRQRSATRTLWFKPGQNLTVTTPDLEPEDQGAHLRPEEA